MSAAIVAGLMLAALIALAVILYVYFDDRKYRKQWAALDDERARIHAAIAARHAAMRALRAGGAK
jgi:peptidoglycan/LPS O-acetylase OafA/YrhL